MTIRGVIGTAGHVDHGKTSLVCALTGVEGDRLAEEKARGITIELGYARWNTPDLSVSIVDVPGHERFVGTMVAGASGIDAVLLVVAADDGVMPQTREHIAICEHLGIARGVIAITKIDAVDAELSALVEDDVHAAVQGTFLDGAPIVRCSSRSGVGIDELGRAALRVLDHRGSRSKARPVWLPVDRVFSRPGHGTIVTGTLAHGSISEGDALELISANSVTRVSVRAIEVHGEAIGAVRASSRIALSLRGVERDAIERGAVLTSVGGQTPTRSIDVALRLDAAIEIGPRADLTLHVGTAHRIAHATMLTGPDARHTCLTRLALDAPIATYAGERFVLRRASRQGLRTIGGGEVVDPHPALARPKRSTQPYLHDAMHDPVARVVTLASERAIGISRRELALRLPPDIDAAPILSRLTRDRTLVETTSDDGARWVIARELDRAKTAVRTALVEHHRAHPALGGATVHELAGRVPTAWRSLVPMATAALVREGAIAGGDRVAALGHDARALADRVHEIYRGAGLAIVDDARAKETSGLPERTFLDVVAELVRDERVERIASGVHVDRSALDDVAERVRRFLDANETLTPGDFKTLSGLTRKHAIAILEWLDRHGVTRRKGEARVRA